jgi:hypothetical protein
MPLYRPRAQPVQAWQYEGYGISIPLMPSWVVACTERRDGSLYLVRRSGKQRIECGEWLIRNLDGDPEWMTEAEFTEKFEEAA